VVEKIEINFSKIFIQKKMSDTNAIEKLNEIFPSIGSFLDAFPKLKSYVLDVDNSGTSIIHLNIVIANIRNILGWEIKSKSFKEKITDTSIDPNLDEIASVKHEKPILILILKGMVHLIWLQMEDIVSDTSSPEEIELYKKNIYALAEE
jgi:hypothetical protein